MGTSNADGSSGLFVSDVKEKNLTWKAKVMAIYLLTYFLILTEVIFLLIFRMGEGNTLIGCLLHLPRPGPKPGRSLQPSYVPVTRTEPRSPTLYPLSQLG